MAPTATLTNDRQDASTSKHTKALGTSPSATSVPSPLSQVLHYPDLLNTQRRPAFLQALRRSMFDLGFFYLADSPLEAERDELFRLTARFFDEASEEDKTAIEQIRSRHFRGWSGLGTEYTLKKPDNRQQIDLAIESPSFPPASRPDYLNLYGPNQFPDATVPELRAAVLAYMDRAEEVTVQLTAAIEEALGLREGRLNDLLGLEDKQASFAKVVKLADNGDAVGAESSQSSVPVRLPYSRMKLVKYGKEGNEQGVGQHRDGGWITLLATDDQPGLQVEGLDGEWIDVPYRPSSILVNFGQQLERVSSGMIRAATHRVQIHPSPKGRISTPYFSMPNLRAVIRPVKVEELSGDAVREWQSARKERKSSVPEGDLFGGEDSEFGHVAWAGLTRSHPATYKRHYPGGTA